MLGPWPLIQVQQKKIHITTHIASHIHIVSKIELSFLKKKVFAFFARALDADP